jgi:hypothetical protein
MLRRQHIQAIADFAEFFGFQQNFMDWQMRGFLRAFKEAGPAIINAVSHLRCLSLTS